MSKKDFRIYCEEEYIDHLRIIADAQDTFLTVTVDFSHYEVDFSHYEIFKKAVIPIIYSSFLRFWVLRQNNPIK